MNVEVLSERGIQRQQQIMLLAKGAARRRRGKLMTARGLGVLWLFTAMGFAAWSLTRLQSVPAPRQMTIARVMPSLPTSVPDSVIQYVVTDANITDRLTLKPEPPCWTAVSDSELFQELAAAGKPAGIVCMNGKTILLLRK